MSKQERNSQRDQDRQNVERTDLQGNKPAHARDPGRPAKAANKPRIDNTARPVARESESAKGQRGADAGDSENQQDLFK